jgi:hypothetical protein
MREGTGAKFPRFGVGGNAARSVDEAGGWGMDGIVEDGPQIQRWLETLRSGSALDKLDARRGLAGVFEGREMYAEAIDLLEANVLAGARSAHTLRWLARLYGADGDEVSSFQVAVAASRLATDTAPPSGGAGVPDHHRPGLDSRTATFFLALVVGLGSTVGAMVWLLP